MRVVLIALVVWFIISFPVSIAIGKYLAWRNR